MGTTEDLAAEREQFRKSNGAWRTQLLLTPTQQPRPLLANALTALRGAEEWAGVLAYDEFALTVLAVRPPPWCRGCNDWTPVRWHDRDDVLTANWLQYQGIGVTERVAAAVVQAAAQDATFHPIRDYLAALVWDNKARVETFAITHLGAEDTLYHRNVAQCFLISAVARIMQPGCKADHMLILEGPQGKGKSSAADALFHPWFSDDIADLGSKDAAMQVRCAWGIEIAELASMTKGETERIKAFVSRRVDKFRPSYGRHVVEVPRQSVFVGTTNADTYLKDETGARRSWPIKCGHIDRASVERDRDQLWAEAVALYREGEPWWLTTQEEEQAHREQGDRYVADAWLGLIGGYLADKSDTSVGEILREVFGLEPAHWTQPDQNRVARCLRVMEWERYRGPRPLKEWRYRAVLPLATGSTTPEWDH